MIHLAIALLLILFLGLGTGCTPPRETSSAPTLSEPTEVTLPADLADLLEAAVAEALGVPLDQVSVTSAEAVEWSNACLDAAKPDEFCAEVITPGYRIVLDTPSGEAIVHSDRTGSSYRLVSP